MAFAVVERPALRAPATGFPNRAENSVKWWGEAYEARVNG